MKEESDLRTDNRLTRDAESARLDRAIREDLERMRVNEILAREDASSTLMRAIEESVRQPLAVAEVTSVLDRLESPLLAEFKGMLDGPASGGLQMEKHLLDELLREGTEGQLILKRGLAFLKHRRYGEALEWWSLNRRNLDASTSQLHLLLLLMESLTHLWAGDRERAEATRDKIRAHKLYRASGSHSGGSVARPGSNRPGG